MNKIFKYTLLSMGILTMAGALSSCEQTDAERDAGAKPVIKYARSCNIDKSDSLIVSAPLGAHICFVGDKLGDVQQVWFNDQKAKLNPNMVTSHTIIVDVPNVIPGEVTNIAKFITSDGTTTEYEFNVFVPAPRIETMSCEYAKAGDVVTINGAYFADVPNVPPYRHVPRRQAGRNPQSDPVQRRGDRSRRHIRRPDRDHFHLRHRQVDVQLSRYKRDVV